MTISIVLLLVCMLVLLAFANRSRYGLPFLLIMGDFHAFVGLIAIEGISGKDCENA